ARPPTRWVTVNLALIDVPIYMPRFPSLQHRRQQILSVAKMPIKAPLTDSELFRKILNAYRFSAFAGKNSHRAANPIGAFQSGGMFSISSHRVRLHLSIRYRMVDIRIPDVMLRRQYRRVFSDYSLTAPMSFRASAAVAGSSPNRSIQCTPRSLRNQVICRLAYCRVAC